MNNLEISCLNSFKTTFCNKLPSNRMFSVVLMDETVNTFIADVERTSLFGKDTIYNKNCLLSCSTSSKQIMHTLYPVELCFYKSAIYKLGKVKRKNNTYDFQNITNNKLTSNLDLSSFILVDNNIYCLQNMSKYGHYSIDQDVYSYISSNNNMTLPTGQLISTLIYDKDAIKEALANDSIDDLQEKSIKETLTNVEYNMLYEIPGNIFNDYESSNIAANTYKCKNNLNSTFDMVHDENNKLTYARQYTKIDHCNNQVYAIYNDSVKYENSSTKNINIGNCLNGYKCDKVEIISKANRYANVNGHSTNAYSLAIYSNLFTKLSRSNSDKNKKISDNLKNELRNVVNDFIKKLAPANTLCMNIIVQELDN